MMAALARGRQLSISNVSKLPRRTRQHSMGCRVKREEGVQSSMHMHRTLDIPPALTPKNHTTHSKAGTSHAPKQLASALFALRPVLVLCGWLCSLVFFVKVLHFLLIIYLSNSLPLRILAVAL